MFCSPLESGLEPHGKRLLLVRLTKDPYIRLYSYLATSNIHQAFNISPDISRSLNVGFKFDLINRWRKVSFWRILLSKRFRLRYIATL